MKNKILTDIFNEWDTGNGIFSELGNLDVPWSDEEDTDLNLNLDLEYFGNVSGDKFAGPLLMKLTDGEEITQAQALKIAKIIYSINNRNWTKLWNTLLFEYDPIQNYKMVEELQDDEKVTEYGKTSTRTDNLTKGHTGTETVTPNVTETNTRNLTDGATGTETITYNIEDERTDDLTRTKGGTETKDTDSEEITTPSLTNTTQNTVFGFNSNTAVGDNDTQTTATGTNTVKNDISEDTNYQSTERDTGTVTNEKTGTQQTSHNDSATHGGTETTQTTGTEQTAYNTQNTETGTQTQADTGSDTETRNYTLTREGNIGVTTSQQMIEAERELWKWNFFRDVVFKDIDKILTLRIY